MEKEGRESSLKRKYHGVDSLYFRLTPLVLQATNEHPETFLWQLF